MVHIQKILLRLKRFGRMNPQKISHPVEIGQLATVVATEHATFGEGERTSYQGTGVQSTRTASWPAGLAPFFLSCALCILIPFACVHELIS